MSTDHEALGARAMIWSRPLGAVTELRPQHVAPASEASAYFALGTVPASYTLNLMEAMAAGVPVVTLGREAYAATPGIDKDDFIPEAYEAGDFFRDAPVRLAINSAQQAHETITQLLADPDLAERAGKFCRSKAEELFGIEKIVAEWAEFFRTNY